VILGYKPTKAFLELLEIIDRQMRHDNLLEYRLSLHLLGDSIWIQEIETTSQLMGAHINSVLRGTSTPMKEMEYKTPEQVVIGEAGKFGLGVVDDPIHFCLKLIRRKENEP